MEAILSGRKVYDPENGQFRDRGPAVTPPERPAPQSPDQTAIFDRIAASLEHANSFDLGTVELQRRFDAFDRADEHRRAARSGPSTAQVTPAVPTRAGTGEFVRDLDTIAHEGALAAPLSADRIASAYTERGPWSSIPGWHAGCGASSLALNVAPDRSTAMFDTGEHVLAAGDLYIDRLHLGARHDVAFSYGQIIAMGDFYESVDQMLAADAAELRRLKALIARNTEFYRGHRRDKSLTVSHKEWEEATNDRYLTLAERNYDHFAPAALLGTPSPGREYDNRRRWEELHRRAIGEMQQLAVDTTDASPFPEGPVITNAFADHFLTDAFASGHLINKEAVIQKFRSRFFSGSTLNPTARTFFEKVAKIAYKDEVAERFSELEPSDPPLCAFGWCLRVHPNIRTAGMFAKVLQQAAEAEPVKIANLAVKVIHDHLNTEGVEVVNDAGDGPWTLTGDEAMNQATLAVMRRAVQQSVDNINDPAILASNLNTDPFLDRVWRHTPSPTPAGKAVVGRALETFTDPSSAELVAKTATLIDEQLDQLVKALIASGKMRED